MLYVWLQLYIIYSLILKFSNQYLIECMSVTLYGKHTL